MYTTKSEEQQKHLLRLRKLNCLAKCRIEKLLPKERNQMGYCKQILQKVKNSKNICCTKKTELFSKVKNRKSFVNREKPEGLLKMDTAKKRKKKEKKRKKMGQG